MKALAIVSGGLDSVTLAYKLAEEGTLGALLSFDYGQRHKKEVAFAALAAGRLGVPHYVMDLTSLTKHLKGSALTDAVEVPEGHYEADTMKQTVVPNRNAVMLAIGFAIATAHSLAAVAIAVHGGDHFIYPDCRPGFIDAFAAMEQQSFAEDGGIKLLAPYVKVTKADIAREAHKLSVPIADTWSCYKGGDVHCGRCGTCVERREAFATAGVDDPTIYADLDFWLQATRA